MTDLTEQWKKGELPEGVYYCDTGNTVETLFTWGKNYHQLTNNKDEVYIPEMDDCEVLAPVPSYEEYLESESHCAVYSELNKQLKEQNAQLKELLKECRNILKEQNFYRNTPVETDTAYRTRCLKKQELLTKIDEVLK